MRCYKAIWGMTLKVATALAAAILLGVAVMPVPGLWWTRLLPLAILAGAVPFVVRGYAVQDGVLLIRRLWWNSRIDLAGLRSVRFDPDALKGSLRTCGNGGLFSFTGWYWNRRLGRYSMYVTDLKRPVVLTFDKRVVVVSPADPEAFVKELALFCKNG